MIFDAFPALEQAFNQALSKDTKADYQVMILHSWQYDEILHRDYQDEIARGLIKDIQFRHQCSK